MLKYKNYRLIEKVFVASNEHAAEVIGKRGLKIKKIARDTSTYIKCPSPQSAPIFEIHAHRRYQILRAKNQIKIHADHFDKMKNKKRQLRLRADEKIETIWFQKIDVACIIGKHGGQVKKIMFYSQVKVISPDTNKDPIFIVCGKERNIKVCLFWMKLTALTSSGNNYFLSQEISILNDYLQAKSDSNNFYTQHIKEIVNVKILTERFNFLMMSNYNGKEEEKSSTTSVYNCWKCKKNSSKVAKSLCGHVISCDKCIAALYVDIYLKCSYCYQKIESFLIEYYF